MIDGAIEGATRMFCAGMRTLASELVRDALVALLADPTCSGITTSLREASSPSARTAIRFAASFAARVEWPRARPPASRCVSSAGKV